MAAAVNIFREMFETKLGRLGQIMRFIEVVTLGQVLINFIEGLNIFTNSLEFEFALLRVVPYKYIRECTVNEDMTQHWQGSGLALVQIEMFSFIGFMMTMPLLLLKSRCSRVGMDNSYQFDNTYMAFMVDRIVKGFIE